MTNTEEKTITNLYGEQITLPFNPKKLRGLLRLIIFPDYAPNKGLPTGSVAVFRADGHEINPAYIGPDIGCGMTLVRVRKPIQNLQEIMNNIAADVYAKQSGLGSLGGGNHFITLYEVAETENPMFKRGENLVVVHSGSREEGLKLFERALTGEKYLREQEKVVEFARKNRMALVDTIRKRLPQTIDVLFDRPHNYVEKDGDKIVYRKGAVKLRKGELGVIPSSMGGEAAIVSATQHIPEIEHSIPHATGRKISRSQAREKRFFLDGFPTNIYIPYFIYPENLNSELPQNYRTLEEALPKIEKYIKVEAMLVPKSTVMH